MAEHGIQLLDGSSASQIMHYSLKAAVEAYPLVFNEVNFPEKLEDFKKGYVGILPQFEAARVTSHARADIARLLAEAFQMQIIYRNHDGQRQLQEHLQQPAKPLEIARLSPNCEPGWKPSLHFLKRDWPNLTRLGNALLSENIISPAASEALAWLAQDLGNDDQVNLSQRKVVVFGASAEMAPTLQFNAAGAEILWLDLAPPAALVASQCRGSGVQYPVNGVDLLRQPAETLATILAFADGQPLDLCLYAYAPGQAREMRLAAAMNAQVNALPRDIVKSVTLLLSPTTATPLDEKDLLALVTRKKNRPRWEAALDSLGLLGQGGGAVQQGALGASRSLVSIQGASYQAAQYLAKLMTAEAWVASGQLSPRQPANEQSRQHPTEPLRVSANTAPITQTRSIAHPIFDAAFGGAAALGVQTFTPAQSQTLNGLLAVHDWCPPAPAIPGKIRVHGGIHTLPYPMETALKVAAAIGFAQSPRLLGGLFRP
ncbi:MAG: hypothetical protein HOM44_04215 [Gammaproteobacteria bacterium]|nr:hypothetical protein [Gammaproteobacteria bacterium]